MRRLAALLVFAAAGTAAADDLALERIMAHPDWIGPPVENARFRWDGRAAIYQLKRPGSPLRDTLSLAFADGRAQPVPEAELGALDGSDPVYARDGRRALFVRDGDVFLRRLDDGALVQLTATEAVEEEPRFSADESAVHWRVGTDWFAHDLARRLTRPAALLKLEKAPDAPDPDALRAMQLRLFDTLRRERDEREAQRLADAERRRIDPTRPPPPVYLGDDLTLLATSLAPDGRHLLAVTQAKGGEPGRVGKMPKYVTESGYEEIEDVRTRVGRKDPAPQTLRLVDLVAGTVHVLAPDPLPGVFDDPLAELRRAAEAARAPAVGGKAGSAVTGKGGGTTDAAGAARLPRALRVDGIVWSRDGARVAVQLRAVDNKDRWIAAVDLQERALEPRHRLTDPAWINWNFNEYGFLADDRTLWFLSEEDGWSHLYTLGDDARRPRRHTDGDWEVYEPQPSRDGSAVLFRANRDHPTRYDVWRLTLADGTLTRLTDLGGVEAFAVSPDERQLLVTHSRPYVPAQLALVPAEGGAARGLTDTRTAEYRAIAWQEPTFVEIPSRHGAPRPVHAKFYRPATLEPGRRYPIVLFVHGAGYTQNVHHSFPYYFREQMFHNRLVREGYVVLDMDFRASEGYGRDWRTAIYRQMGHPELEDLIDGVEWLVANAQGDRERVGVYGGSYGGFMALMALFRAPEVFHAGAALRPVTDWTQYNHEYTSNILNTPDVDPEAYRKSSPIEYADRLQGQLLIAHGMLDDNVFYQDAVRLAQRLIELRKPGWELASYPLERHSYVHPESWYDQYRRIEELFRRTLRPFAAAP